jgi:hypothetical protein
MVRVVISRSALRDEWPHPGHLGKISFFHQRDFSLTLEMTDLCNAVF